MDSLHDIAVNSPEAYINREMSWLNFSRRVLELAEDTSIPLFERVKFAGIMDMIYDEFAMKRIGGLRRKIARKSKRISPDGHTPTEELLLCRAELNRQTAILSNLVEHDLRPLLNEAGLPILDYEQLNNEQRSAMQSYFHESVAPILTPLAVDIGHPFPFISNLGLNAAVMFCRKDKNNPQFIRIKIPPNRPRWVPLRGGGYVPLEQVISHNLNDIYPDEQCQCHFFRVIRGAKDNPWDRLPADDIDRDISPGSIIDMVSAELTARKYAGVVRLQVTANMSDDIKQWLVQQLNADAADIIEIDGLLGLGDLVKIQPDAGFKQYFDTPHIPVTHPRLRHISADDSNAIFAEIRAGDMLLHHPYHNFDTSTLRFIESAAHDPQVLAIKLTIYRTSRNSPIIKTLIEAARRGKQVAVLVEITARFDEEPNIAWGEELEKAGAHVIYGMERLKTHVKLALVVREEEDGLRRYVHVSTGNYHTGTARLYEDLGLLSCDTQLGASVANVFNELTGAIPTTEYAPLLVAPHNLRQSFIKLIQRESAHCQAGKPCGIWAKMNQLQDPQIIQELYRASQAGVPVTLCIRGLCCLRAGVEGLSPTIRVYSVLGRFLEHSRIYRFENGGNAEHYIGSADWMLRNLDRRMETILHVTNPKIQKELDEIIEVYEKDNCFSWDMQQDGSYLRRSANDTQPCFSAQQEFINKLL